MGGQPHYPTDDDAAAVLKQCAVHDSRDSRSSRSSTQRHSQAKESGGVEEWMHGQGERGAAGSSQDRSRVASVGRAGAGVRSRTIDRPSRGRGGFQT
jgi:hypothetical protein